MMATHWQTHGYTAPNADVYPWQWLWDSCFHALIWHELGESERALTEVRAALADPHPTGFVPHMRYTGRPEASVDFWGRRGASSITQPPMYGHALAQLDRAGVEVDDRLVASARDGLEFLLVAPPPPRRSARVVPSVGVGRRRQSAVGCLVPGRSIRRRRAGAA